MSTVWGTVWKTVSGQSLECARDFAWLKKKISIVVKTLRLRWWLLSQPKLIHPD